ncbi:MFS transporter [Salinarimonas ramus]|uniref:MFS transporter n=1 Tax=Salinarimonas ramus TaxID=690164 RepID=A0A917QFS0_9HYPH|nr:MFS transporter [Salinarimonas ramus]GGK48695.1 MFS transporter [Salinarimonas ramus]
MHSAPDEALAHTAARLRAEKSAPRCALFGWVMFDWATQPFFTLVVTFVFGPYFVNAVAANPVAGQSQWMLATSAAGLSLAILSPVLGAIADAGGPKKPWILAFGALMSVAAALLWLVPPAATPGYVLLALVAFAVATVAAELAGTFNNAMMPTLVPPHRLGRLSGAGWATGYAGGLVSLAIVLGLLAGSPQSGLTLAGLEPLLGLDPVAREGDRVVGPLTALWFALFVLPLVLFTPDVPRGGRPFGEAVREGLSRVRGTIAEARRTPAIARFLLAHMAYQDGLVVLFSLGTIYGAGIFGWGTIELGVFGILILVTGTLGALAGGPIDDRIGPRAVILGSLAILALVTLGVLSLGESHVLFVVDTGPPPEGAGLYASLPEKVFLGLGLVIGALAGPLQASSRSLLARLVPAGDAGRYFGLLALSGKLTAFLGPFLVAVATALFQTQAAGPVVLLAFFLVGALLVRGVPNGRVLSAA